MGVFSEYLRRRDLVPDGIQRPFTFFRCIYVLNNEEWKTADNVSLEAKVPVNTVRGYLKIAYAHGLVERKKVPSSSFRRGGKVYAYRLNVVKKNEA